MTTEIGAAADALLALAGGAPALAVALLGWWLNRRDYREQIRSLREDNARLLEAFKLIAGVLAHPPSSPPPAPIPPAGEPMS